MAEKLITEAMINGLDWIEAKNIVDLQIASKDIEDCMMISDEKYEIFIKHIENENEDRADLQQKSLLLHRDRQIEKYRKTKLIHEQYGDKRIPLVKATEGKIYALQERINIKLEEINKRRKLKYFQKEICLGIINVE